MNDKIKTHKRISVFILYGAFLVLLLALSAWALVAYIGESKAGRHPGRSGRVTIDTTDTSPKTMSLPTSLFFASKSGTKYYPETCTKGNRVKPENRIYFESAESAQRAGLQLASGC